MAPINVSSLPPYCFGLLSQRDGVMQNESNRFFFNRLAVTQSQKHILHAIFRTRNLRCVSKLLVAFLSGKLHTATYKKVKFFRQHFTFKAPAD